MSNIKAAILTRVDYRSPRFLALGLERMLMRLGIRADIFFDGIKWVEIQGKKDLCRRNWIASQIAKQKLKVLQNYDLIFIVDTISAFRDEFNITLIRQFDKPVFYYEVFYLGGSKHWLDRLPKGCLNKFDVHLSVSGIHDNAPLDTRNNFCIGLDIRPFHSFQRKRKFTALLDFAREGYEKEREVYKRALTNLRIPYFELKGEYNFKEIEYIYKNISVAFVSFLEAFGVPIAQLQNYGACIVSPHRKWVKRHSLLPQNSVYFDAKDPKFSENFVFFQEERELEEKLFFLKKNYDATLIRSRFLYTSPHYAIGNIERLWASISQYT